MGTMYPYQVAGKWKWPEWICGSTETSTVTISRFRSTVYVKTNIPTADKKIYIFMVCTFRCVTLTEFVDSTKLMKCVSFYSLLHILQWNGRIYQWIPFAFICKCKQPAKYFMTWEMHFHILLKLSSAMPSKLWNSFSYLLISYVADE